MTVYCPPIVSSIGLRGWSSSGASPEAQKIEHRLEHLLAHFLETRLQQLIPEIVKVASEHRGIVDLETVVAAIRFAYVLPRFGSLPEVSVDPDGEISFDWAGKSGEILSVSIDRRGRLAYAAWFGEGSRTHGIEGFADRCPKPLVRAIERINSSAGPVASRLLL